MTNRNSITFTSLLGDIIRHFLTYAKDTELVQSRHEDLERFRSLAPRFQNVYSNFAQNDCSPFLVDAWKRFNDDFVAMCDPSLPENFLHHPIVLHTLTGNPVRPLWKPFLAEIFQMLGETNSAPLLKETLIGNPRICEKEFLTSPGRITHLWMLASYIDYLSSQGKSQQSLDTIIEFGGGFGGLAHVWSQLGQRRPTYVIFDSPIMCAIQWQYLSALNGEDLVTPIFDSKQPLVSGTINLLPVSMLSRRDLSGDVFVSTWALSESNDLAQQAVIDANWFSAPHILLAFQRSSQSFPLAERFKSMAAERGGLLKEMPYYFANNFSYFV